MYRIPSDLNLSKVIGQFTTQLCVGQFDIQFSFGEVHFAVQSSIELVRNGEIIGGWHQGEWPTTQFYEIMNAKVARCEIPNERTIVVYLDNSIEIHLRDDSDEFECIQISFKGDQNQCII
ncbi:MAG: hypothetical protein ACK5X0_10445 [Rhodospirillales bacterium]|jgi:hypothetical protein